MDDFLKKQQERLRSFCRKIDRVEEKEVEKIRHITYYNIHKRSLPVGIDTPVMFHLEEEEAKMALTILKSKVVKHPTEDDDTTIIYYDMIKEDAKPREKSVYFNEGPAIK